MREEEKIYREDDRGLREGEEDVWRMGGGGGERD